MSLVDYTGTDAVYATGITEKVVSTYGRGSPVTLPGP